MYTSDNDWLRSIDEKLAELDYICAHGQMFNECDDCRELAFSEPEYICVACGYNVYKSEAMIGEDGIVHPRCLRKVTPQPPNKISVVGDYYVPADTLRDKAELLYESKEVFLDSFGPRWAQYIKSHPNYLEDDCALDAEPKLPIWWPKDGIV